MKKESLKSKEKKRGMRISLGVHGLILLLGILPFMSQTPDYSENLPVVEIAFVHDAITSGAASEAPKKVVKPTIEKKEAEKPTVKKADAPKPKPIPVVVSEEPSEIVAEEIEAEPVEEVIIEEKVIEEVIEEDVVVEESAEEVLEESIEEADGEKGEGDKGEKITGKALGSMDFEGEGIFGRKVIFRADVKKITEKEGRVVINLCINRLGIVTHVAFNKESSSIYETDYVKKAMDVASDYLFEKDYSAPESQCGKLSFIFKIE